MKKVIIILAFLISCSVGAQQLDNYRVRTFVSKSDTVMLDSLSIIPTSFKILINDKAIADSLFSLKPEEALLHIDSSLIGRVIKTQYRVFPIDFSKKIFHKDYSKLSKSEELKEKGYYYSYQSHNSTNYFKNDLLEKRGDISRGISFGNNQDVIVNSSLNLQLSGKLNKEFEIRAAITDDNIPIQPDGNSQQIQEFDKIYIQLFNDNTEIRLGDFEIESKQERFLRLNKKAQGALFSHTYNKESYKFKTTVSAAVAKGKYNRLSFKGVEGNQGPYKLQGSESESYIIILAGSEKVYIDGKLLVRGQDNDYTIDYNQAELSFTPKQIITKDKRIIIEFEYSERNYARFMLFNNNEFIGKKAHLFVNVYSEQDSKNQPLQQQLGDSQKQLLSEIGDSLNQAFVPNIDSLAFTNDRILYSKTDSIVNGVLYPSVYRYSTNPDSAHYSLGFSYVGEGLGNYIIAQTNANGKVYKWLAPDDSGNLSGSYQPVVLLVTPKKKQVVCLGGEYNFSQDFKSNFEISISNNDINTFSNRDAGDNVGFAINLGLEKQLFVSRTNKHGNVILKYQMINRSFNAADNFRDVEYNYDWNKENTNTLNDEHILELNVNLKKDSLGTINYNSAFIQQKFYRANKNSISANINKGTNNLKINSSYLFTADNIHKTGFLRNKIEYRKKVSALVFGIIEENENNSWRKLTSDSLGLNSFAFNQLSFIAENADTTNNMFQLAYISRKDLSPVQNKMSIATESRDLSLSYRLLTKKRQSVKTIINYRKLLVKDTTLSTQVSENTINSRLEMRFSWWKSAIVSTSFYEIGSGLEQKKEYSFIMVSPGQGMYIWNDYNGDNVKQLDEFEISTYQDTANYIRVFVPSNNYEKILSNRFSQVVSIRPDRFWRKAGGVRKLLSHFSNKTAFKANRKNSQDNFLQNVNPFIISPSEDKLKSLNASFRNTFSFNKTSSRFGIDYLYQNNSNKLLLINGFDTRIYKFQAWHIRWKLNKKISLNDNIDKGHKQYESDIFQSKNYKIDYLQNDFILSWQSSVDWRISLNYQASIKNNISNTEQSKGHNLGFSLVYNILTKGNLNCNFNLIMLEFNNENTNTPIAYEMLNGLQPGNNYTWAVQYQSKISDYLQINLNYNGQKSENYPSVHTGSVSLRAYF